MEDVADQVNLIDVSVMLELLKFVGAALLPVVEPLKPGELPINSGGPKEESRTYNSMPNK